MLKHYLKNALKAFFRNKFIAFINIFGISFTLMMVTLIFSFINLKWGTDQPNKNKYKIVDVNMMSAKALRMDTIYQIDSSLVNQVMTYDTTGFEMKKGDQFSSSNSSLSFGNIKTNISNLKTPINMTFSTSKSYNIFLPSGKIEAHIKYTDHRFWEIYNYQLIKGTFFNEADVTSAESKIVLTEKFTKEHFGNIDALDKVVRFDGKDVKVIGIVMDPKDYSYDCFVAYTHLPAYGLQREGYLGSFWVNYLVKEKGDIKKLKEELKLVGDNLDPFEEYNDFTYYPTTYTEAFARGLMEESHDNLDKAMTKMYWWLGLFGLFLVLLPALNLLNINLSRILERRSEIGVRKSFGANSWHIFSQFLMENVLLSLFAGVLAFIGSYFVINFINGNDFLEGGTLELSPTVLIYGMMAAFLFGILFGVIPAIRLSKLNIVKSLKS